MHRINLLGSFLVASNVAAILAAQGGTIPRDADPSTVQDRGVIILTSSVSATEGQMGQVAYGSSKAAVEGLVLPMARDLARYGASLSLSPSLPVLVRSRRTCRESSGCSLSASRRRTGS